MQFKLRWWWWWFQKWFHNSYLGLSVSGESQKSILSISIQSWTVTEGGKWPDTASTTKLLRACAFRLRHLAVNLHRSSRRHGCVVFWRHIHDQLHTISRMCCTRDTGRRQLKPQTSKNKRSGTACYTVVTWAQYSRLQLVSYYFLLVVVYTACVPNYTHKIAGFNFFSINSTSVSGLLSTKRGCRVELKIGRLWL